MKIKYSVSPTQAVLHNNLFMSAHKARTFDFPLLYYIFIVCWTNVVSFVAVISLLRENNEIN